MDSRVDLPQPEGPAIEMYVPLLISRCISSRAWVSTSSVKKTFFTPCILISVPFASAIASPLDPYSCSINSCTSPRCFQPFASFVAQRHQRIDPRGASRRNVARCQRDQRNQSQTQRIHCGIASVHTEKQRFTQSRKPVSQRQPDEHAEQYHRAHFLHDEKSHVRCLSSKRHTNANFTRALHHKIRQHTVNAHSRKQRRQCPERRGERRNHPLAKKVFVHHALHRLDAEDRKVGVQFLHRAAQSGHGKQRILLRVSVKSHFPDGGLLRVRQINIRNIGAAHVILLYIFHHADDLDIRLGVVAGAECKM